MIFKSIHTSFVIRGYEQLKKRPGKASKNFFKLVTSLIISNLICHIWHLMFGIFKQIFLPRFQDDLQVEQQAKVGCLFSREHRWPHAKDPDSTPGLWDSILAHRDMYTCR